MGGVYQADFLTMLIRQFLIYWFKIPFLGEAEAIIKSQFGYNGLSMSDSILDLLSRL